MLKKQIQEDITKALKEGNREVAELLRMMLAAVNSKEKEKRYKISKDKTDLKEEELQKQSELTDEEIINALSSEIKKRKDAISLYEQGNRPELAVKEQKEIEFIKKYLPEQLSGEELKKIIEESVLKVGAKEMKDIGKVMADLMSKVKGRADNAEISKIVKELIAK